MLILTTILRNHAHEVILVYEPGDFNPHLLLPVAPVVRCVILEISLGWGRLIIVKNLLDNRIVAKTCIGCKYVEHHNRLAVRNQ